MTRTSHDASAGNADTVSVPDAVNVWTPYACPFTPFVPLPVYVVYVPPEALMPDAFVDEMVRTITMPLPPLPPLL